MCSLRAAALRRLSEIDKPDIQDEIWRYSRIGELDLTAYAPSLSCPSPVVSVDATMVEDAAATVVLSDGWITTSKIGEAATGLGLFVGSVGDFGDVVRIRETFLGFQNDFFDCLNCAFGPPPLAVVIPDGLQLDRPIVIRSHVSGDGAAAFPRLIIHCGIESSATVLHLQTSDKTNSLVVPVVEAAIDDSAQLCYAVIQDLGPRTWQVSQERLRVGRDASLELFAVGLGGEYARSRTDCQLVASGAEARITAAYFGDRSQTLDYRTFQEHAAPHTTSELLFKGAVDGMARSVYTGLIRVSPEGIGSRAYQTNRNIKLSPDAWAESVPNLEIETDDVMCSHASTVSPVDEDQRFYLESRGVPTLAAERLLLEGFFEEVVALAPLPSIARVLRSGLSEKLERHDAGTWREA